MKTITCDDTTSLMTRWQGEKNNKISYGTLLRVRTGQAAIFLTENDEGSFQDIILGPFEKKVEKENVPNIAKLFSGFDAYAEVFFLNTQKMIQMKFGIPFFDVFDNEKKELSVPIAVRGTLNVNIIDIEEFINIFGLRDLTANDVKELTNSAISRYVKAVITNYPEEANVSCLKLETKITQINEVLEKVVKARLQAEYGLNLTSLDIEAIEINKESSDFRDFNKVGKKQAMREILHKFRIGRAKDDIEVSKQAVEVVKDASQIAIDILDKLPTTKSLLTPKKSKK